jgi:hypothetical protein
LTDAATPRIGDRVLWQGMDCEVVLKPGVMLVVANADRRWVVRPDEVTDAPVPPWPLLNRAGRWQGERAAIQTALKAALDDWESQPGPRTRTALANRTRVELERLYPGRGYHVPSERWLLRLIQHFQSTSIYPLRSSTLTGRPAIRCPHCLKDLSAGGALAGAAGEPSKSLHS